MSEPMYIPLTQGKVALVSPEDFERVTAKGQWAAVRTGGIWYACKTRMNERPKSISMHRFILGLGRVKVDHEDGNGLNNQRSNLRPATASQNAANRHGDIGSQTGIKGVYRTPADRFYACITCEGQYYYLGTFDTDYEAGLMYDSKAVELFGSYARTNFDDNGNLRPRPVESPKENENLAFSRRLFKSNRTGFRGVSICRKGFRASIGRLYIGEFKTAEEAALIREAKAVELCVDKTLLNFERP